MKERKRESTGLHDYACEQNGCLTELYLNKVRHQPMMQHPRCFVLYNKETNQLSSTAKQRYMTA
jgi:hypothetical protein